ncbi:MAG: HAMP domain-containing sensor histidine kinase [Acidimicrobiia bacterium]|nr:HAMP domain-containing sensor histidine kinase [Acidimicrobiia bacterium]
MRDVEETSVAARFRGLISRTTGEQRVWALAVMVAAMAGGAAWSMRDLEPLPAARTIPLLFLAAVFYIGEITVVHVKFKRNTQSFSMSEIPLVLGLFFAAPIVVMAAQLIGNAVALTANRRQPLLKLVFNLGQFSLVTAFTVFFFRTVVGSADPFGPAGWAAAIAAVALGNVVANALVHLAIRATGGNLTREQIIEVLSLSTMGAAVNASIAILGVTLYELRPAAAWLAALPLIVLYAAYRAYMGQKQERYRLESLYEMTRLLHASPQIDVAMEAAASQAQKMFESERVDVLLLDQAAQGRVFQTTINSTGTVRAMVPVGMLPGHDLFGWLEQLAEPRVLTELPPIPNASLRSDQIMAAPLTTDTGPIGAVVVTEPLSDVGGFGASDVKLLGALADKISVSLRNGRLEDSLEELTHLKERLEEQVRSKDQFIATVSHELRTPLTTVMGLSHELGERRDSFSEAELDEMVSLIANESSELSNLIEDLLVGARADVSTLSLHSQFAHIGSELAAVIEAHAHQQGGEPVEVRHTARWDKLWADPLRFRQIVRNLLSNASRYGGPEIWIEVFDRDEAVVVAVVDNGRGVPAPIESRIFDAYERGDEHKVAQPGSVGLGLAVSRRLAGLMDGSLEYRRVEGATRFELALPAFP